MKDLQEITANVRHFERTLSATNDDTQILFFVTHDVDGRIGFCPGLGGSMALGAGMPDKVFHGVIYDAVCKLKQALEDNNLKIRTKTSTLGDLMNNDN